MGLVTEWKAGQIRTVRNGCCQELKRKTTDGNIMWYFVAVEVGSSSSRLEYP